MNAAVELDRAGKRFGDQWVVRELTMTVTAGSIVGLVGPSGCGKTTTVRMVTGAYHPDEGTVRTLGGDPTSSSPSDRQRLGYLPQQLALFDALSVWENLRFHASLSGVRHRRSRHLSDLLSLVDLADDRDKRVSEISGGMRRRLALAATVAHGPDLLLLDEPTAGIDPILRDRLWQYFRELAATGTTLVVTTQYVGEAAHCDVVGVLGSGRLLHYAPPEDLRRQAFGGERLRVVTDRPLDDASVAQLGALPDVGSPLQRDGRRGLVGTVDDAGSALVAILRWLDGARIGVVDSEEIATSYEEAFVRLVGPSPDDGAAVSTHGRWQPRPSAAGSP